MSDVVIKKLFIYIPLLATCFLNVAKADSSAIAPMDLLKKNSCLACHGIDQKLVGPSYNQVFERYQSDKTASKDKLISNILGGSKGNWGEMEMPPQQQLSKNDAEIIVEWILSKK